MNNLSVSRLISDHMVLQWGKPVNIWGTDEPGSRISVRIAAVYSETVADDEGKWMVTLPVMRKSRTGLTISIENDRRETVKINDVLVGDVWFMSGQSNMDLLMERARDRYPNEFSGCANDLVRVFRIIENGVFGRELEEPETGTWRAVTEEMLPECSATVYFFTKYYTEMTGTPVGVIHASLGGSLISTWMSREMLQEASDKMPDGYQQLLAEADRYASESFVSSQLERNARNAEDWNTALLQDEELNADNGFAGLPSGNIQMPCFFKDIEELNGFTGLVILKKKVSFTEGEIKALRKAKRVRLFLGTMVDRDETFVNGVKVGDTGYQYPPRKYEVPPFILKQGENEITIRLFVEGGYGRIAPGKIHALIGEGAEPIRILNRKDHEEIEGETVLIKDLEGEWEYQVVSKMPVMPGTDFINWHPTALYNGMAAPCRDFTTAGVIWYQGESNAGLPLDYEDLFIRYINGYRHDKKDPELPVVFVQLPNFVIDNGDDIAWPELREKQRRCQYEEQTAMVCAIDLGEDNDLHPTGKRELGRRIALSAAAIRKAGDKESVGPEPVRAELDERDGEQVVVLKLSHAEGVYADSVCEDHRIVDFVVLTPGGRRIKTVAQIDEAAKEIVISRDEGENGNFTVDSELRYIDSNTYHGDIIYNGAGLPMAPFRMKILGNWRNRKF